MKVGVIGLGYWGPNLLRNFLAHPKTDVVYGFDINTERLNSVKKRFPNMTPATSFDQVLNECEAIAIATPVAGHYEQIKAALNNGKHVLVEKPFTTVSSQAAELVKLAEAKNLTLMVDHTFVFTSAVQKLKDMVRKGELGDILYFDSVRINLGLFRHDCNVLWDLAYHDLSILQELVPDRFPHSINALGKDHYDQGMANIAYLTLNYPDDLMAAVHVSWLAPVKHRKIIIGGSKKMVVYDDMEVDEKIKIFDKGVEVINGQAKIHERLVQYRIGDIEIPQIKQQEALSTLIDQFITCIETNQTPVTSGLKSLDIVRILEAAEHSMTQNGSPIEF